MLNQCQELLPSLLLRAEAPEHARGDGERSWLLHAAHGHAKVAIGCCQYPLSQPKQERRGVSEYSRRLHNHGHPARLDRLLDGNGNLLREALLHLEAPAKCFGDAGELGEPENELAPFSPVHRARKLHGAKVSRYPGFSI